MAAIDDVDQLIEQYDLALGEFYKGNPEPVQKLAYMIALTIITIISVYLSTETFQKDISEERLGEGGPGAGREVGG